MSKAGQRNYKGVEYQAWAALLLFLIRLKEGGFVSVTLEDDKWEDFTLAYTSGKKIVCEAKYYARPVGASTIKGILGNILGRKSKLKDSDEIIIICPDMTAPFKENLEYIKYFPAARARYKKLKLTDDEIDLLAKTTFFLAPSSEFLYQEAMSYFYSLITYWLPSSEIDRWLKAVLVDQVFTKSTRGDTFTRLQLAESIEEYRKEQIQREVDYDSTQRTIEYQMNLLLGGIKRDDPLTIKRSLISITALPDRCYILIDKVASLSNVKLSKWDFLWEALLDRQYVTQMMHAFEKNNLNDADNARYILQLLTSHIDALTKKTVDHYHAEFAVELVRKILESFPQYEESVFDFCKAFLEQRGGSYLELKDNTRGSHEKQLVAVLLYKLTSSWIEQKRQADVLEVIKLIDSHFNLVDDDGNLKFFIYTPRPIFDALKGYLLDDYKANFPKVKKILVEQFRRGKFYGNKFDGWEIMGGSSSNFGNEYTLDDRHFIAYILKPVSLELYSKNPGETWKLLAKEWITRKKDEVSDERPDFLNRAAIDVLLMEYHDGENSDETLAILKDFIGMNKGIPAKSETIFEAVRNNPKLTDEQRWQLVEAYLAKYKLPYTVFVEQIVSDLALRGNEKALGVVKDWVKTPEYREQQKRHSFFLGENMLKLLNSPSGTETFRTGVEVLKDYINTDDYQQHLDTFDAYDITESIAKVVTNNLDDGLQILWDVYRSSKSLTNNQQIAISNPLLKIDKENPDLLQKVYDLFVKPLILDDLKGDIQLVEKRFTDKYARELFVQFAEHLAEAHLLAPALALVRVFINDSNPRLENESDDPDGTFNNHAKIMAGEDRINITTVRGWCAWVLSRFPNLYGRDYLAEVTELVEILSKDENFYVRVQATFALSGLMQNRHTVMPDNAKERFISLELAKKIEDIAFAMLRDEDNQRYPVILRHLGHVFSYMRSMTESQALEVLALYKSISYESDIDDIYPLFLFFALFRKDAFKSARSIDIFGKTLYDELNRFDDTKFRGMLEDLLLNGTSDVRRRIAWQFWQLPREAKDEFEELFALSIKYLTQAAAEYDKDVFDEIYYFVNEFLERKPIECIKLWRVCIKQEKDYLVKNEASIKHGEWWPNHFNGKVLTDIKKQLGDDEFIESATVLLSYPEKFDIGVDVGVLDSQLKELITKNNDVAKVLWKQLADRFPRLYDDNS